MEPYWTKEIIAGEKSHEVKLFKYSAKCIAMTSTNDFGRKFSTALKEIGGRYNPKLSVGEGWIFRLDSQQNLTDTLRKIFKGEIKPRETEVRAPIFEDSDTDYKIFSLMDEVKRFQPEDQEEVERTLTESKDFTTTIYFNKSETTLTQGDLVFSFTSSRGTVHIYQLQN